MMHAYAGHWIEQIFGFAPDHGDGSLEWLVLLAAILGITTLIAAIVNIGLKRKLHRS